MKNEENFLLKRTKIIATIGPSFSSEELLRSSIENGVNALRINFAHNTLDYHKRIISIIRKIRQETGYNVAILGDIAGPKLRASLFNTDELILNENETVFIFCDKKTPNQKAFYINYPNLAQDVKEGEPILLDDGKIVIKVKSSNKKDTIEGIVVQGGILKNNKGVNLPSTHLSLPALTEKDIQDVLFATKEGVNWLALSFVRSAKDIVVLKNILGEKIKEIKIIAKIEKPEAIENIEEIINEVDGVMIARGDLGVEMDMKKIPILQKKIINLARKKHKISIVATQVIESMIDSLFPKRAEITDVATAIFEGADAIMVSNETSVGKHPIRVIQTLSGIIQEVEKDLDIYYKMDALTNQEERFLSERICYSAIELARVTNAKAIATMTFTGYAPIVLSSFKPSAHIFAFTSNYKIIDTLQLVWGVNAFYYDKFLSTDHTIKDIKLFLLNKGFLKKEDIIITLTSMPIWAKGQTNTIKVSRMGED